MWFSNVYQKYPIKKILETTRMHIQSFNPSINLITGANAQGKTNLLESLVYLSLTRSHRIVDDKKLIRNDEMFAGIDCKFVDTDEKDIEVIYSSKWKNSDGS